MSRKGDCYDNAPMESFWGLLKNELVHHKRYQTRREAVQDVTEYIEIFYNRQRRQLDWGTSPRQHLYKSNRIYQLIWPHSMAYEFDDPCQTA